MAVLAGYVTVLSTGPVAANVRLVEIVPDKSAFWYSVMAASGALVAALTFIVVGRVSNRLLVKTGSRQRIFIFSAAVLAPLVLLIATADSVPSMLAAWCLLQIPAAAILSTSTAVVLELVPERLVGVASGLFGAAAVIAIFFGVIIGSITQNNPTISLAIGVTTALILTIPSALTREFSKPENFGVVSMSRIKAPKTFWFFIIAASFSLAVSALSNDFFFQLAYKLLNNDTEAAASLSQSLFAISASTFLLFSILGGLVSRRTTLSLAFFRYSLLVSAVGLTLLTMFQQLTVLVVGVILVGVGTGLNVGSQLPVMRFTLNGRKELGREAGIYNVASMLPAIIIPGLAAALISVSSESWPMFLGAIVSSLTVIGALLARTIRIR